MIDQARHPMFGADSAASTASSGETSSPLADTAISHCEKLRRVLRLEDWINVARDVPMLAAACRRWEEERAQLLAELDF